MACHTGAETLLANLLDRLLVETVDRARDGEASPVEATLLLAAGWHSSASLALFGRFRHGAPALGPGISFAMRTASRRKVLAVS